VFLKLYTILVKVQAKQPLKFLIVMNLDYLRMYLEEI